MGFVDLHAFLRAFGTHRELEAVLGGLDLYPFPRAFLAHPDLEPVLGLIDLHAFVRVLGFDVGLEPLVPVALGPIFQPVDVPHRGLCPCVVGSLWFVGPLCDADRSDDGTGVVTDRRDGQ